MYIQGKEERKENRSSRLLRLRTVWCTYLNHSFYLLCALIAQQQPLFKADIQPQLRIQWLELFRKMEFQHKTSLTNAHPEKIQISQLHFSHSSSEGNDRRPVCFFKGEMRTFYLAVLRDSLSPATGHTGIFLFFLSFSHQAVYGKKQQRGWWTLMKMSLH